jgi:hypothetical protein
MNAKPEAFVSIQKMLARWAQQTMRPGTNSRIEAFHAAILLGVYYSNLTRKQQQQNKQHEQHGKTTMEPPI